jgi:hypothetical protein
MIEQQLTSGQPAQQQTLGDDRSAVELQVFADDDESCFHDSISEQ